MILNNLQKKAAEKTVYKIKVTKLKMTGKLVKRKCRTNNKQVQRTEISQITKWRKADIIETKPSNTLNLQTHMYKAHSRNINFKQ